MSNLVFGHNSGPKASQKALREQGDLPRPNPRAPGAQNDLKINRISKGPQPFKIRIIPKFSGALSSVGPTGGAPRPCAAAWMAHLEGRMGTAAEDISKLSKMQAILFSLTQDRPMFSTTQFLKKQITSTLKSNQ